MHRPPENEKKLQTTITKSPDCNCQCSCNPQKKRRKVTESHNENYVIEHGNINKDSKNISNENKIPVIINSQLEYMQRDVKTATEQPLRNPAVIDIVNQTNNMSPTVRMSTETQDSDELLMQLEKLFQGDPNDDDLFDDTLCDNFNLTSYESNKLPNENSENCEAPTQLVLNQKHDVIENHSAQIKSLDERLASLTGLLVNKPDSSLVEEKPVQQKPKRSGSSKWLCEEYFLKSRLFELLDQIGDTNRKKLEQVGI